MIVTVCARDTEGEGEGVTETVRDRVKQGQIGEGDCFCEL